MSRARVHKIAVDPLPLNFSAGKPFYVYLYRDSRPRKRKEPIYVGKGTAQQIRAEVHLQESTPGTNRFFKAVLRKIKLTGLDPIIEIVAGFDNEGDAFALESALIKRIGRRNLGLGPLCNLTDGGEGTGGHVDSPETRVKKSTAARHRTPRQMEVTQRMSEARRGTTHSAESLAKMSAAHLRAKPPNSKQLEALRLGREKRRQRMAANIPPAGVATPSGRPPVSREQQ